MWLVTAVAITGTVINVLKNPVCFILWCITNLYYVIHNLRAKNYQMALLFGVYLGLSVWGLISWLQ
jgi:nicotinamide riboside transporter PnuC